MEYTLPQILTRQAHSKLTPYFERTRGDIIPGAHRLQKLLKEWIPIGILRIPCILITGSNGKGTTCAILESLLRAHGLKTGLYTSPHLVSPNERVRIHGLPVSLQTLETQIEYIMKVAHQNLPDATFFELITAAALCIFHQESIDILICEVGLGGRFDSTNALSPLVSVLTSVSLEHTEYLGSTVSLITKDKSYIARKNRPFIVSDSLVSEALDTVKKLSKKLGFDLFFIAADLPFFLREMLQDLLSSPKLPQFIHLNKQNIIAATSALYHVEQQNIQSSFYHKPLFSIDKAKVYHGILSSVWPGRFDVRKIHGRDIIFDASHNPEGFNFFLNQYKQSRFQDVRCIVIFCILQDKDWNSILKKLFLISHHVIFTQISSKRSESASTLAQTFQVLSKSLEMDAFMRDYKVTFSVSSCLSVALEEGMNCSPNLPLLLIGSIAFLGEAMERFGLSVFGENL